MPSTESCYVLGPYTIDLVSRAVTRDGAPLKLAWRHFEALKLLVEANQGVVPKEQFFHALWPDTPLVDESNLTQCISQLRKALGNGDRTPFVETVPRIGYRLLVPATKLGEPREVVAHPVVVAVGTESGNRATWLRRLLIAGMAMTLLAGATAAAVQRWQTRPAQLARAAQERAAEARRRGDVKATVQELQLAVQLDPRNALAYGELAHALNKQRVRAAPVGQSPSVQAAARGVEIDPNCGVCHGTLGFFLFFHDWQWTRAESHYTEALRLSPQSHAIRPSYAMLLAATGRPREALPQIDRALDEEPYQVTWLTIRATILYLDRRYQESVAAADRALAVSSREPEPWQWRSKALFQLGRREEAIKALVEVTFAGASSQLDAAVRQGGAPAALRTLVDITGDWGGRTEHALRRSHWRALLGDADGALTDLESAYELRNGNLLYIGMDPVYDGIRDHPRFQRILAGMGLRPPIKND
jgi:DNA-binding winged helix-turn-helix (wHTH) protein/Tfp pilus assembly protein PilF